MSTKKFTLYLEDADVTLRSDHLPLRKLLAKNTLHSKVNNWAIESHLLGSLLNTSKELKIP